MRSQYTGHISVKEEDVLVQGGPYRLVRHPAYSSYLLMSFGVALGYSSIAGGLSFLILSLPAMVYRIRVEETVLVKHFGEAYIEYARSVKRLIPGIW